MWVPAGCETGRQRPAITGKGAAAARGRALSSAETKAPEIGDNHNKHTQEQTSMSNHSARGTVPTSEGTFLELIQF
jgi:hypothetical protein